MQQEWTATRRPQNNAQLKPKRTKRNWKTSEETIGQDWNGSIVVWLVMEEDDDYDYDDDDDDY